MENFTETIKDKLKIPRNLAVAAGLAGLLLGLLIGYVFPVPWTDASAENLRPDLRVEYLRNAITTYTLTGDKLKAMQAYAELGEKSEETLMELTTNPGFLNSEQIQRFSTAINAPLPESGSVLATPSTTLQDGTEILVDGVPKDEGTNSLLWVGLGLLGVLIIGAGLAYWFYFKEHGFNFGTSCAPATNNGNRLPAVVKRQPAPVAVQRAPIKEVEEP